MSVLEEIIINNATNESIHSRWNNLLENRVEHDNKMYLSNVYIASQKYSQKFRENIPSVYNDLFKVINWKMFSLLETEKFWQAKCNRVGVNFGIKEFQAFYKRFNVILNAVSNQIIKIGKRKSIGKRMAMEEKVVFFDVKLEDLKNIERDSNLLIKKLKRLTNDNSKRIETTVTYYFEMFENDIIGHFSIGDTSYIRNNSRFPPKQYFNF